MSVARRWCALGAAALAVLQVLWHGWLAPPASHPWLVLVLSVLPLLPALVLFARRHPRAPYWAAVAALLYFCHGIMEAWADRTVWPLGVAEAALAAWVVGTYSWDGLRARLAKRRAATPPV